MTYTYKNQVMAARDGYGYDMAIVNAFSLNMLSGHIAEATARIRPLTEREARVEVEAALNCGDQVGCAIGHPDTAAIVGGLLGMEMPASRASLRGIGRWIVAQYSGPRLAEGTTALPAGASIQFFEVRLSESSSCTVNAWAAAGDGE